MVGQRISDSSCCRVGVTADCAAAEAPWPALPFSSPVNYPLTIVLERALCVASSEPLVWSNFVASFKVPPANLVFPPYCQNFVRLSSTFLSFTTSMPTTISDAQGTRVGSDDLLSSTS